MMNPYKTNNTPGLSRRIALPAALVLALTTPAQAAMDELLETLVENEAITEQQAERIRDASARVPVEPAGTNFGDFRIRGRIQTQFGYTNVRNDEISENYSTLELRRVRLGARAHLLQNVRAQLEANLVPGSDLSMRSAFLQWREYDEAHVKVGVDKPVFGFEENTSSAAILTVERTLISNTVAPGAMAGLAVDGSRNLFSYGAGVYTDRDNRNTDGMDRYLYNLSGGVSLGELVGNDRDLDFRIDFIASDDGEGNFGDRFQNGASASGHYVRGPFDLRAEIIAVEDRADDNTYGWYVMPSYYFTDKFQGVLRYEEAYSDNDAGLRATSRYARRVPGLDNDEGDTYRAVYGGANYYFAGNANKVMAGVELSQLDDTADGDLQATTVYGAWRVLF